MRSVRAKMGNYAGPGHTKNWIAAPTSVLNRDVVTVSTVVCVVGTDTFWVVVYRSSAYACMQQLFVVHRH